MSPTSEPDAPRTLAERPRPTREDVRTALLTAAAAEFAERGFGAASVESIAARAGFTKGAVYGNFEGKAGLFLELLERQSAAISESRFELWTPPVAADGSTEGALRALAEVMASVFADPRPQLLLAEVRGHAARRPELAEQLGARRARQVEALAGPFERVAAKMGLRWVVPVREATYLMLALSNGVALEHVGAPGPVVSPDTIARVLSALVEPLEPLEPLED